MKEINKYLKFFFIFFLIFSTQAKSKVLSIGNSDAKVTVKVFSSLTCPHCANFHTSIFNLLKKEYIDNGLVKFEHHAFPLDLAALNAELVVRCAANKERKFKLLEEINNLIKKVGLGFDLTEDKMNLCLKDSGVQDEILNERIEAQKKYKIESTPTIIINGKKYSGKVDYEKFKKVIEKNL